MPRGGKRPGAGRKRTPPKPLSPEEQKSADEGAELARRILSRIKEGAPDPDHLQSEEDYALDLLFAKDLGTRSYNFNRWLDRLYGSPERRTRFIQDKPIEMNVNLSMSEIVRQVRERKRKYEGGK